MTKTYKIVRFFSDDTPPKVIHTGLDLETAKMHCSDSHTKGESNGVMWFEGFTEE